jgi:hypothetical protein
MSSLRQVIEQGQYELAAYRLVFGAVQAYLQQHGGNTPGTARETGADGSSGCEVHTKADAGG